MEKPDKALHHAERKFIHLLLTQKIDIGKVQPEFPPTIFDAYLRPLVTAIYEEFSENGQALTRVRYRQKLVAAKVGGDLIQNMTTYDRCFMEEYAKPEDFGELKQLVFESAASRVATQAIQEFEKTSKSDGYCKGFDRLREMVNAAGQDIAPGLEVVTLADVEEEEIEWLWQDRIAMGKLSLFVGDPCTGKSFVTLNIGARLSKGLPMPATNQPTKAGDTIILSSEDGIADTIAKRYRLQGGDPKRVHIIKGKSDGRMFSLDGDLPYLASVLKRFPETRLIVIDPLNAYLGKADSYKDADIRRVLSPLCAFADRHKVAVIGIQHLTKSSNGSAMYRGLGSIGFTAAARASWLFTRDADDEDRRLMVEVKNNLTTSPRGLAYRILPPEHQDHPSMVAWESGVIELTANEALQKKTMPKAQAKEWLETILEDGPVPSKEIFDLAQKSGISASTLKRAKSDLHIAARQVTDHWEWSLPTD